jgi:NADH/NAD ratio-sensing transcriptional regulator Rex
MTDTERIAFMETLVAKGHRIELLTVARSFSAHAFGRVGYGYNLGEAVDELRERIQDSVTARVAAKLTA